MNACTSPRVSEPLATRRPPTTATSDVVEVPENIMTGRIDAGDELGPVARVKQGFILLSEGRLDLLPPAERLDQRVPGVRLLDLAVQPAGVLPLVDELRLGPLGDLAHGERRRQAP